MARHGYDDDDDFDIVDADDGTNMTLTQ